MRLDINEVNNYLRSHLGPYEDSIQQAWLKIIERDSQTMEDVASIARKVRNKALRQYLHTKFKEQSLFKPIGRNGNEGYTLESILASPTHDKTEEKDNGGNEVYLKIIDFLIAQYISQKEETAALKRQKLDLKMEKLRVREEEIKFKRHRFESWKKLMEQKGKEKENRLKLKIQLQREKYEFIMKSSAVIE